VTNGPNGHHVDQHNWDCGFGSVYTLTHDPVKGTMPPPQFTSESVPNAAFTRIENILDLLVLRVRRRGIGQANFLSLIFLVLTAITQNCGNLGVKIISKCMRWKDTCG
jgi:hypothetical protein